MIPREIESAPPGLGDLYVRRDAIMKQLPERVDNFGARRFGVFMAGVAFGTLGFALGSVLAAPTAIALAGTSIVGPSSSALIAFGTAKALSLFGDAMENSVVEGIGLPDSRYYDPKHETLLIELAHLDTMVAAMEFNIDSNAVYMNPLMDPLDHGNLDRGYWDQTVDFVPDDFEPADFDTNY